MSIKERPLIKAVERLGPLPGFLFSHPILAGFFAMFMCPVFGAVTMMFFAAFGTTSEIFEAAHMGAVIVTGLGVMIFISIFFNAFRELEELANRMQFVFGGALCLAFLIAFDRLATDHLRAYFAEGGKLICTSVC